MFTKVLTVKMLGSKSVGFLQGCEPVVAIYLSLTARLCRFNYILFIQRLLDSTSPDYRDGYDPDRRVIGLDMYVQCSVPFQHNDAPIQRTCIAQV